MIETLLKELGFAEKEIRVYLTVLEQGKVAPANIARLTGIKRPTVYSIAKELIEKGVILEDIGATRGYLVALPPENLKNLTEKAERSIAEKKVLIGRAIGELQNFSKHTQYSVPKITFIYKEDLENFLYKQSPEWNKSIMERDGIWWGYQDPSFVTEYQKWIDWYWTTSAPKELVLKLLSNDSDIEKKMRERKYEQRIIRFWGGVQNFTGTTWVCGNYLILIVTSQKPFYLVQIHDATLAHNMRELFKGIWKDLGSHFSKA